MSLFEDQRVLTTLGKRAPEIRRFRIRRRDGTEEGAIAEVALGDQMVSIEVDELLPFRKYPVYRGQRNKPGLY